MYCTFFGMRERPFTLTPNPEFIYLGMVQQEAFGHLIYGIEQRAGFICLTGEVGTGKTTVVRTLLNRLNSDSYATALILNPVLSPLGLLKAINHELGIHDCGNEPAELVNHLNTFLLTQQSSGKNVVLIIDETQDLPPETLEQIRLLSNLETTTQKLLQIILVGQPELETLLKRDDLRQLNQRITVRYHITPMGLADTQAYIKHRLHIAGSAPDHIRFSEPALKKIYQYSSGYPRLVNAIADRALLMAYTENKRIVDSPIIIQASRDIQETAGHRRAFFPQSKRYWLIALLMCTTIIILAYGIRSIVLPSSAPGQVLPTKDRVFALQNSDIITNICEAWSLPTPIQSQKSQSIEELLQAAGFEIQMYQGTISGLAPIGYPAVLEMKERQGDRGHVICIGINKDNVILVRSDGLRYQVAKHTIEQNWTGRALIPWRNALHLSIPVDYIHDTSERNLLYRLLLTVGAAHAEEHPVIDEQVIRNTLIRFQKQQGITSSGVAGANTLFLLYRNSEEFRKPSFSGFLKDRP